MAHAGGEGKYHASFESSWRENAKSLFGPCPFQAVLLFALLPFDALRLSPHVFVDFFERVWPPQTDDRLLSRWKL